MNILKPTCEALQCKITLAEKWAEKAEEGGGTH